jgi:hypothetical protein
MNVDGPAPEQTPDSKATRCLLSIPTTSRNISHDVTSVDQRSQAKAVITHQLETSIESRKRSATEFMPVGYWNAAALQDGGQIVRVELPRTTLASFGLPVNMDRYNEKVKADVLLGVDGMAHAIRFVQEKRLQ